MASKRQQIRIEKTCACGCGKTFFPFPIYKNGFHYPEYIRGHSPASRKSQFGVIQAWNKGLRKGDHPSLDNMGFKKGHDPLFDFKSLWKIMKSNPEIREKWINSKKGKTAWNKGLTKERYPNGTTSGPKHGNWMGNKRGLIDLAIYKTFTKSIRKRDKFTCQICGVKKVPLDVHHIIPISHDINQAFNPDNCITLCKPCHRYTDTYGSKANRKKKEGN